MMRFLTSDLRRNITKTVCLTLGLAIGFMLVAKIFVEKTFDSFYPASDRTYFLAESLEKEGEYMEYNQVPGGIAPNMLEYCPQVEAATRRTYLSGPNKITLEDRRTFEIPGIVLADTAFFDVLPRPILAGNPKEALEVEKQCFIPRSLAEKIGDDVVGQTFTVADFSPEYKMIIAGVFEDYPINSSVKNQIILSLSSIGSFMGDGRMNMMGNDRYVGFVRLAEGADTTGLQANIKRMLYEKIGKDEVDAYNFNMHLRPLADYHGKLGPSSTLLNVLAILAVVILISASLNYLLIVIGQMGSRFREMAVRKCYGTSATAIFMRVMGESLFFLVVSIILAVLIVLVMSPTCERILGYSAADMLTTPGVWAVELGVCAVLFIITGVIPAWMYCRTPVAHVFHQSAGGSRAWKLALLAVQFFATGLLVCLLVLVMREYHHLSHVDRGYDVDNIGVVNIRRAPDRQGVVNRLRSLACVEGVATTQEEFSEYPSGNNVWNPDDKREFPADINVGCLYLANPEVMEVLGLRLLEGRNVEALNDSTAGEVIVDAGFRDVLAKLGYPDDGIVGKTFHITEFSDQNGPLLFTIAGVVAPIKRGNAEMSHADTRGAVYFPASGIYSNVYIRFTELNPSTLAQAQAVIDEMLPDAEILVIPFRTIIDAKNEGIRNFGDSVMIAGIAVLLIALIGLIGYSSDEVQRRSREIAIRKVNGTDTAGILRLFCLDITKVALPSLILGGAAAMIIGRRWLAQFTDQVPLSPLVTALSLIVVFAILIAVVALNSLKVARSNPVEYLRAE